MSEYIIKAADWAIDKNGDSLYQGCEEIVRCRYCRHYHAEINGCDEFGDIWHDEYANVEPDGFCKWGERSDK